MRPECNFHLFNCQTPDMRDNKSQIMLYYIKKSQIMLCYIKKSVNIKQILKAFLKLNF